MLKKTRQAIVEELVKIAVNWGADEYMSDGLRTLESDLSQVLNDYTQSIVKMVDEQIKIWKSMDEDLPVPKLQDQIVEALNDIKEALNNTK